MSPFLSRGIHLPFALKFSAKSSKTNETRINLFRNDLETLINRYRLLGLDVAAIQELTADRQLTATSESDDMQLWQ